ncbi:MAG: O-antigen ligase family protein, partial [Candidatus Margulisiibacteriota bacterium]|nr:O-antigen ligase family protein [Candidatus Margulisiibacteriota bacterium]
ILFYVFLLGVPYLYYGYTAIKKPSIQNQLNILFNSTILITYATYLSYSRATWLGLTAALGLLFTITIILESKKSTRNFLTASFGCLLLTIFSYLFILFKLYTLSITIQVVSFVLIFFSYCLINISYKSHLKGKTIILGIIIITAQFFISSPVSLVLIAVFSIANLLDKKADQLNTGLLLTTFIFTLMNVQFFSNSIIEFINFILLITNLFIIEKTTSLQNPFSTNPILQWKIVSIAIIMIVILSPKIYLNIKQLSHSNTTYSSSELLIKQASSKISSYSNVAIEGTARTSMWKSSFPWIKDHLLIGSGLDTIKYLYPKYRRPEYGKLEGGHNFTPDRLHNEYLNVLATKGVVGFIIYYLVFIGGNFLALLLFSHKSNKPNQYLILGLIGSALVYLGQVMFNFGVVATLVYFFIFIGLAVNLKLNYENN